MSERKVHDQVVTGRMLGRLLKKTRETDESDLLEQVGAREPELAQFIQANGELLAGKLTLGGAPREASQGAWRLMVRTAALCVLTLQRGHFELWRDLELGSRLTAALEDVPDNASASTDDAGPEDGPDEKPEENA